MFRNRYTSSHNNALLGLVLDRWRRAYNSWLASFQPLTLFERLKYEFRKGCGGVKIIVIKLPSFLGNFIKKFMRKKA